MFLSVEVFSQTRWHTQPEEWNNEDTTAAGGEIHKLLSLAVRCQLWVTEVPSSMWR